MLLVLAAACTRSVVVDDSLDVSVDPEVSTMLRARWIQSRTALARVEYRLADGEWSSTPERLYPPGEVTQPIVGLPPDVSVEVRLVGDGQVQVTRETRTEPLPDDFPVPTLVTLDPDRAGATRWLLVTADAGDLPYAGPWWVYILDRFGRVVWYHAVPEGRLAAMARVSPDESSISWEQVDWFGEVGSSTLERATLDGDWSESIELPGIDFTYDELQDGTVVYGTTTKDETFIGLRAVHPDGRAEDLWNCLDWYPDGEPRDCSSNTANWDPVRGTYLWSLFALDTVLEVDPVRGVVGSWGALGANPIDVSLKTPHYPNWGPNGTLFVSTQFDGALEVGLLRELAWDPDSGGLREIWSYGTDQHFPASSGEVVPLPDGNLLANSGSEGTVYELSPDGDVVWEVDAGALLGHQEPLDDLYALLDGPGVQ